MTKQDTRDVWIKQNKKNERGLERKTKTNSTINKCKEKNLKNEYVKILECKQLKK